MEPRAKPAKAKIATRPAVARQSRAGDDARVRGLEQRLAEALEQKAAMSEVLSVISHAAFDLQPVFDMVAERAVRLCAANKAFVYRLDGDVLRVAATHGASPELVEFAARNSIAPGRQSGAARAALTRETVHIADVRTDPEYTFGGARVDPIRTVLAVPILKRSQLLGVVVIYRLEVKPFTDAQITLIQAFADQAAIAIENVRLLAELQARNRDLTVALDEKTATGEILRVISRSQTDVQPVFDAIADSVLRLCDARFSSIYRFDGELIHLVALANVTPEAAAAFRGVYPTAPGRGGATHRAILTRGIVHIPDVHADSEYVFHDAARTANFRSALSVPMLRDGNPIGTITVYRDEATPFPDSQIELLTTFADQAVIAIENARLFRELGARNAELTEALEQQTATSEILRVISRSPTDVQPVFDTIAAAALKLCGASSANVFTVDGEWVRLAALGNPQGGDAIRRNYPRPIGRDNAAGRAVLTCEVVTIPDVLEDPEYGVGAAALAGGFRSVLAVPLIREERPIGAITVGRPEPGPFSDKQVALLRMFSDQAVIAIENVRLFKALESRNSDLTIALDHQTATSEILRVISSVQTDVQPVFDTIVRNAVRLCGADHGLAARFDGKLLHALAHYGFSSQALEMTVRKFPMPPSRESLLGRAGLTRAVQNLPDMLVDPEYSREFAIAGGWRSGLAVPMLRDGTLVGAIAVSRTEVGAFPDHLVTLLKTFADQAVIAIENVRLFTELQARNSALTEALEQQTATSEILRVISSSPTDVQPVFDIIGESAEKLCAAEISVVSRVEGERILAVAIHGVSAAGKAAIGRHFPMRMDARTVTARSIRERAVVHVSDVLADPDYEAGDAARAAGYRGSLGVPMLREGQVIGAIFVARGNPGLFADSQVELLKTFADQAVIAVENVRLFKELDVRNRDLTEALEQQTATSEVLKVISRSAFDLQPVLDIVIERAARLCGAEHGHVHRFDGEFLRLAAGYSAVPAMLDYLRDHPARLGPGSISGMAGLERRLIHWHDVLEQSGYQRGEAQKLGGFRTMLAVPMLSAEALLGVMVIWKTRVEPFTDKQIELVTTFADQAVIAIENVRLFKELGARNTELTEALEQQTATSEILRVISSSPTDVQPVFDIIAQRAGKLCDAEVAVVSRFDGKVIELAAIHGIVPEGVKIVRTLYPMKLTAQTVTARVIRGSAVVHIPDVLAEQGYELKDFARAAQYRSGLGVPVVRNRRVIGSIFVGRAKPGLFTDSQVQLLKTFADQAVIAVENVRLFTELDARTRELTRSVDELKALGEVGQAVSSTLDLETVLSTIVSRATELAGMDGGAIHEYDEASEVFHLHTTERLSDELVAALRSTRIRKGEGAVGRLAVTHEPVEIRDIMDADVYQSRVRDVIIRSGFRSLLAVPLLREDHLLGGLVVCRNSPGAFAPEVIGLLQTFATQSALAIQNARLFREIEDKGRQLETASRHKSEFLANMSHELRTPLNAIIGFSEVLSERMFGEVNDKQAEYLGDILESGRHLLSLINDILDLAKIEAGRMELEPADFDLAAAIDNTLVLVRERAQRRGIALTRTIDPRVDGIRADERKVKQVLLNLLSNALKFTPEGGRIAVAAEVHDGAVTISVTDTGVGIAPEDQATVFEEFRQVGAAARKVEGTGLGLAISRKFIELHGGRIWVESAVGTGSTFAFTLPLPDGQRASSG